MASASTQTESEERKSKINGIGMVIGGVVAGIVFAGIYLGVRKLVKL